jgi:protein TonB
MKALLSNWENVVNPARNELVFQNRNKSYGAFAIRKAYDKDVLLALTFSLGLLILIVGMGVFHYWKSKPIVKPITQISTIIDLTQVTVDHVKPVVITPVDIPRGIKIDTRKYFIPVLTKEETTTDEPLPPIDDRPEGSVTTNGGLKLDNLPPDFVPGPDTTNRPNHRINDVFEITQQPEYPGGIEKFYKDVYAKIRYPETAIEHGIEGNVPVEFVIEPDGSMSNIKALRNESVLGDETVRVFSNLNKWKPGRNDGKPVRVRYNITIKFRFQN